MIPQMRKAESMNNGTSFKRDIFALIFGVFIVLTTFGDQAQLSWVGNLDTIFGKKLYPFMDVFFPTASIVLFLLYGSANGNLVIRKTPVIIFLFFLLALVSIVLDDIIFVILGHPVVFPEIYRTVVRWEYPIAAAITFLAFGRACRKMFAELP